MPVLQSRSFGDLYVEANIETPINLSNNQKNFYQSFMIVCRKVIAQKLKNMKIF